MRTNRKKLDKKFETYLQKKRDSCVRSNDCPARYAISPGWKYAVDVKGTYEENIIWIGDLNGDGF